MSSSDCCFYTCRPLSNLTPSAHSGVETRIGTATSEGLSSFQEYTTNRPRGGGGGRGGSGGGALLEHPRLSHCDLWGSLLLPPAKNPQWGPLLGPKSQANSWPWVWASSRSWWWTGKLGLLQSMGSQRVGHDWADEPNWGFKASFLLKAFSLSLSRAGRRRARGGAKGSRRHGSGLLTAPWIPRDPSEVRRDGRGAPLSVGLNLLETPNS